MKILIDADALPVIAKELIIKTANRTQTMAVFVANRMTKLPPSPFLSYVVVGAGFDVADEYILQTAQPNDLVITSDIPLANDVLEKRGKGFDPTG